MRVNNAELREAFLNSPFNAGQVAKSCGWLKDGVTGDSSRVLRPLGLKAYKNGQGMTTTNRNIDYDNALKIAEALGLDPVDVGL